MKTTLSILGLLMLVPTSTTAGPLTFVNFTAAPVSGWISPLVPADVLMLDRAPFTFAEADGTWELLAEQSFCGDNRIGWTTPASTAPPIIIFDGADTPGTLMTPPEAIAFTYQVGDDGAIWTSAGADDYLHFTLLQVAADEDTYYLGMTADCAMDAGGEVIGVGLPGLGGQRGSGSVPPDIQARQNYALIRITLRRSPPPPPSGGSVPEPGTLGLIGAGAVVMWIRRRR